MKVIIAGSRSITDINYIYAAIEDSGFNITEVVSGTASGVDTLGEEYAKEHNISIKQFPADWKNIDVPGAFIRYNKYGKYNAIAGHQRNAQMANYADVLIAIWDGKSKGTLDMISRMKAVNKTVFIYAINKVLYIK